MAIKAVDEQDIDDLPSIDEVMERYGVDRDAAGLYLAVKSGWALVGDLEFVPDGQREAVLREEEANEAAFLAAMEHAAEVVDPDASVEENVARTGLDRRTIETYLSLRPREA